MDTGYQINMFLEEQLDHYQSMKQVVEKQTRFIEVMDIGGLTVGTSEMRGLMRKSRDIEAALRPFRQSWNNLGLDQPVKEKRRMEGLVYAIREQIEQIQEIKDRNKLLLEKSMEGVRKQMTGLETGAQATRAYVKRAAPAARFIDRSN
ncbi:MAG: flagellar export chaperone FlgN [bacterium]|nr:flagellar export chaperone FlgN [bacterium]